jgi:hypothetical protein
MNNTENSTKKVNPPYSLGLLGIIPLVGFFVGIGLTYYGVSIYKDKKLAKIGIGCMLFSVLVYATLIYESYYSDNGKKGWENLAQTQLNSLVKSIELYKIQNGKYPNNLEKLADEDDSVIIFDPTQSPSENSFFIYQNLGNKYLLFSRGTDKIKNTKDDIYPEISITRKTGWIKESKSR